MDTKTTIVIAAHGVPAVDYPGWRVGLLMALEFAPMASRIGLLRSWQEALDRHVRDWPRTPESDPYKAAVDELAADLSARTGWPVIAGYNEFCAPTIGQAIDQAVAEGAGRVVVLPTMLVRGNEHTELEIRETVVWAGERHPSVDIRYAWPFDQEHLVGLLAHQVSHHAGETRR